MLRLRRTLAPSLLIAALAATLLFAANAAAEIKIGEGTSPEQPAIKAGEADLLKASVEYDTATGSATVAITTRQAQETTPEKERPFVEYLAGLVNVNFPCTRESLEAESKKAEEEEREIIGYPIYEVFSFNQLMTEGPPGVPVAQAYAGLIESQKEGEGGVPKNLAPGTKVVNGTTATTTTTLAKAANVSFNCAEVIVQGGGEGPELEALIFPLTTKPEPPAPPAPPTPQSAPEVKPPAPAPGVLSIAKAKPLTLAADKWATVKLKFTNTGGSAIPQGSLRVRAPKGVIVKPARQRIPSLLPGDSWTVSARVKLTEKAKASSTVTLTASSGGLTAATPLVLKLKG